MGEAQRKPELTLFDIQQPRKKGTSGARKGSAAASRASGGKAKPAGNAKKPAAKAASGAKPAEKKSAAKPAATVKPAAKKPVGGTKSAAAASKQGMKTQTNAKKRPAKRPGVEENPLAALGAEKPTARAPQAVSQSRKRAERPDGARPVRRPKASNAVKKPAVAPQRPQESPDEYDLPSRPARKRKGGGKKRRRRSGFSGVSALLLVLIACLIGVGAWRVQEYEAFAEMKAAVSRQTFYQGTTVEGIDVSNMTLAQAVEYWRDEIEPRYSQTAAVLNDGTQVTAAQLGYSSNYAQVLTGAWNAGRSGSLAERYRNMENALAQPVAHEISRSAYDEELVQAFAAAAAQQVDRAPVNAKLRSFNLQTHAFEFDSEQNGYSLDQAALVSAIEGALDAGGGEVMLQIATLHPAVTRENVAAQYGMITSAVTNASSSRSNRLSNIKLSLELINGTRLEPGESFSFNEAVGQRTKARGFKTATAYSSGKVTEEVGGGICQVSTTLFNAAVKADLKIDERHPHSLTVSYVDLGKDAAVDWGNKDLKFTNNTDDTVYLICYLSENERVYIEIYGKLLEDGQSITVESEKTGSVDYDTEYQMSFDLYTGQTKVIQNGKKGAKATAYKVWWDAQGNEIRREELAKSRYQATDEIIAYGP